MGSLSLFEYAGLSTPRKEGIRLSYKFKPNAHKKQLNRIEEIRLKLERCIDYEISILITKFNSLSESQKITILKQKNLKNKEELFSKSKKYFRIKVLESLKNDDLEKGLCVKVYDNMILNAKSFLN